MKPSAVNSLLVNAFVEQILVDCRYKLVSTVIGTNAKNMEAPLVFSFTTNPPPTLKYSLVANKSPFSAKQLKRMPFGWVLST